MLLHDRIKSLTYGGFAYFCYWLLWISPIALVAQTLDFERIPNELGLSQNLVSALCQDRQGFLWVGTKDGLNRFDGYEFRVFQHDPYDTTSLPGNHITTLLEDSQERLWVGTMDGLCLLDRRRMLFRRVSLLGRSEDGAADFDLSGKSISSLCEDRAGHIWIGTDDDLLIKLALPEGGLDREKASAQVFRPTENIDYSYSSGIKKILQGPHGRLWVLAKDRIFWIDETADSADRIQLLTWEQFAPEWQYYQPSDLRHWLSAGEQRVDRRIYSLFTDDRGAVWLVSAGGFSRWDPRQNKFKHFPIRGNLRDYAAFPLEGALGQHSFFDDEGKLWHAGRKVLIVYDTTRHELLVRLHTSEATTPEHFRAGFRSLYQDANNNVWVGTNGRGLFKYTPHRKKFSGQPHAQLYTPGSVYALCQTSDRSLWVGTSDKRLIRIDPATGRQELILLDAQKWPRQHLHEFDHLFTMAEGPDGALWAGGRRGLYRLYKDQNGRWDREQYEIYPIDWEYPMVMDIHFDAAGDLWLLTPFQFGRFDVATDRFEGFNFLSDYAEPRGANVPRIHQQSDSIFWLGTSQGLYRFHVGRQEFTLLTNDPTDRNSLSHPVVKCIQADPRQPGRILWIGTGGGGLNRYDTETGQFTVFTKRDGLPDNVVYGILPDETGRLWLSTNQGLARFDPTTLACKNYGAVYGLQNNEFNTGAYHRGPYGWMLFGGINGFNAFDPATIEENDYRPPVVITDFKIANASVDFRRPGSPLTGEISQTRSLTLPWNVNIFSFTFAALDFTETERNQYAYQLENFHEDWQYVGTQRTATFTNLDPGTYIFRVKGTNHEGVWNEQATTIEIMILPPWWRTWWAYLLYGIVGATLIVAAYRFQLTRQLEQVEAENIKNLDRLKNRFYTNITHEFRTPLTVILGMTETETDYPRAMQLIRRNGWKLLRLINQLLDLSKLDNNALQPQYRQIDVISYAEYIGESLQSLAERKQVELTVTSEVEQLWMDLDEELFQQIVTNLLTNAIKFTPAGGWVRFSLAVPTDQQLVVVVQDNGVGIPAAALPHIFDRFYQVDHDESRQGQGTGIGLALVKELVGILEGKIDVRSAPGRGTRFTVTLPIRRRAQKKQYEYEQPQMADRDPAPTLAAFAESDPELPSLLIIEDSPDVVVYIQSLLRTRYAISVAENGAIGIERAIETVPDIIISDVMMPEKDGFAVVEILKQDERTSHIPIILLTARATQEDRLAGLRYGADAYLMKPFDKAELLVRLEQLVALRQTLQAHYAQAVQPELRYALPQSNSSEVAKPSVDDLFLQKFRHIIDEKIADAELDITYLCRAVGLSATQLNRKVKALTGEPPMSFVRKVRLHRAQALLRTTDRTIAEIAYDVGFSDPNYFTRAFGKEFGNVPSEVRDGRKQPK